MSNWEVRFHVDFDVEFQAWPVVTQDELLAKAQLLARFGPALKRPHADKPKGSKHANMKELRFDAGGGVWRVAYAFDPERNALVLVGGDKAGTSRKRFYKELVRRADARFAAHLASLAKKRRLRP